MAVNVTKTSHFTGGAGTQISFSQIRAAYGGSATNISASTYLRNDDAAVDWDDESTITSRVPDATENVSVATDNNWSVDSLRNTISNYLVTQSGTDTELEFSDSNTGTWNNNLSKNVPKTFDVTGIVHADSAGDDALRFSGDLYNLEIEVDQNGAVYGQGGSVGGNGGDALYVNNTYTQRDVEIRSYGKIWAGGGGGSSGNDGNKGSALNCSSTSTVTRNINHNNKYNGGKNACKSGEKELTRNPIGHIRGRCRGRGSRRGGGWNQNNKSGYHCGTSSRSVCQVTNNFTVGGGGKGNGGNGGVGKGWSNRNLNMNQSPHKGNSGNSGNTNSCAANGNNSTGNSGNSGNSGGDWGIASAGSAGRAIQKKGAVVNYYTDNTVKGQIKNI